MNDLARARREAHLKKRGLGERGQSMTEFTLLLPLLLILLLGLVEFGHALNSYLTVVASARDSARLAAAGNGTTASMLSGISNEMARLPSAFDETEPCTDPDGGVCIGGIESDGTYDGTCTVSANPAATNYCVTVKICYDHPMIFGIPFYTDGHHLRMCSQTKMRLNQ